MTASTDISAPSFSDPILCDFELPIRASFHPLGFTVNVRTNSREVIRAAEQSWGLFCREFSESAVNVDIGVLGGGPHQDLPPGVCRGRGNLVTTIADSHNFSVVDLASGFGYCWITESTASGTASFRYNFLEGMVLVLLGGRYLTPIHAACVSLHGRGVLLCGDSGAGKSSLAFACARRGWTFTSDDASSLVRTRLDRTVVGNCHQIRFRQAAVNLFPELSVERLTRRVNGEFAIEVPTAHLPDIKTSPSAPISHVVFLNRKVTSQARLRISSRQNALQWFEQFLCLGGPDIREPQRASLQHLMAADPLELEYSDLDSAVTCLEALIHTT